MKNWKLNVALVVGFYLVFMAAKIPAALIAEHLTLPPELKISGVSGSVWQGRAAMVQYKNDRFSDVDWQLSPWSLLIGNLSATVKFGRARDANGISGTGDISSNFAMDQFSVSDFTLRYPAAALIKKAGLDVPLPMGGKIELKLNDFVSAKPYCEVLDGTLVWRKASLQGLKGEVKLGQLEGDLSCKGGEVVIKVSKKNPLGLQVTSVIGAKNKFTVNGFIKPNGDMPNEVHQAMKFLGRADSQGRFPLKF